MRSNRIFNVIIDTNVIVSALLTDNIDSATFKVLKLFFDKKIVVYYSQPILDEYIEVLSRKRFGFDMELVDNIKDAIETFGIKVTPENQNVVMVDIKDKPFYELLMDEHIDDAKLVTGNIKHFPIQANIVTPSQFMEIYNKG